MDEVVDRQQLDRVDPERHEVLNRGRVCQSRVSTPELLRDVRVALRKAFDVKLVHDRLMQRSPGRSVLAPIEPRIDDNRARDEGRAIVFIRLEVVAAYRIWKHGRVPTHLTHNRLRVRIDEQLVWVAPIASGRVPRAMHAITVPLSWLDAGDEPVPAKGGAIRKVDSRLRAVFREQAQLDSGCDFRKN